MRRFLVFGLVLPALVAGAVIWWLKIDRDVPLASLEGEQEVVGRAASWVVNVSDRGRSGLRSVVIRLISGDSIFVLAEREFAATGWSGSGIDAVRVPIEVDLGQLEVPEGDATLEVLAETHGWRFLDRQAPTAGRFAQTIDRAPPQAQVVSQAHNLRLGGSAVAVFRIGADATEMEVLVDRYRFPVMRGYFADPLLALAVFAVPEDLDSEVQPYLHVSDAVGNSIRVPIISWVRQREFRQRTLAISDGFLERKIPQLFASQGLAVPDDLLAGYLRINRETRKRSEGELRELMRTSLPQPQWTGAFQRMARSKTMSEFGDRRAYSYGGEIVDRQIHLGVDLASLRQAEVGAAQGGRVVFASDLGIYGNTVVLDHGLGIFTLYGHLSSVPVQVGDDVTAGQTIGRTGQTGLAGGDHLHYSTLVHGVHVDPVEWWDARWLRDHVDGKLAMFPAAASEAREPDGQGPE